MKFLIFTCLLAVVLAKHKMVQHSSSEESVSISQEKFKQEKSVVIYSSKQVLLFSQQKVKPTVEKTNYLQQLNKVNQFYQNLNFLQYLLQASDQHQIVMSPWDQIKTRAYTFIPTVETPKKTVDMKTELTEEENNYRGESKMAEE
uniref:alpha-S2-casein-like n=1 Tax=Odobenus rosmarus divergens TaxID=9708 RepID=UPI00063C8468|nr:PREDICTED: alpha-S2-casein-like [Odobenus rosmarus divergens]